MRRVCAIAIALAVSACASQGLEAPGPRVGEVLTELPPDARAPAAPEQIQTGDAVDAYRRVENTLPDNSDNQNVDRRIAELNRRLGTEQGGSAGEQSYRDAITRYESLLDAPDTRSRDDVLYHLAETYELLGDVASTKRYLDRLIAEYPQSDYRVEAHFRRAELAFSADAYQKAATDYAYVVEEGSSSALWPNANYMLGWALLKQNKNEQSLDRFLVSIDVLLRDGDTLDAATQEMLDDTTRAIVLAVTYLDGARTLADRLDQMQKPAWQYRVYERLADDLRRKQRFLDSVATLETFVERNQYDPRAPQFSQRAIETLMEGNFPAEARKHKEAFITRYRFDGDFWVVNGAGARDQYVPVYRAYLMEVAKLAHRDAQQSHAKDGYLAAAAYYGQFSETFHDDPAAGEALFLEGEALTDAHEPARAVVAYQRVLHEYRADPRAAEAAYAAILALDELLRSAEQGQTGVFKRRKIDAQIEYASTFPAAAHASEAQVDAANELFAMQQLDEAARLAQDLLARSDNLTPRVRRIATLILAQIAFEQLQFDVAEERYRQVLRLSDESVHDDDEINARLLASIYKQGEAAEARGDFDTAVRDYLRIADDGPDSELAVKGHFDAVAVYESAERWSAAADLLRDFRTRYPHDPLAAGSDTRLAELYERAGRRQEAADAFHAVAVANAGQEKGRQALYHAAELYVDVDSARAIDSFLTYENSYPEPTDLALEAAQQLDVLYQRTDDEKQREHWLRKKIEIASRMGDNITDRARYLAADAQFKLAAASRRTFDSIALSGALAKQIAAKQAALKSAIAEFEKSASYGVEEFATASTYEIADTYAALARDLLSSARPAGLSDLERQQYDVLLEEQASPFEEQAIAIHEINVHRMRQGIYDVWIVKSLDALRQLMPARYDRQEVVVRLLETIR